MPAGSLALSARPDPQEPATARPELAWLHRFVTRWVLHSPERIAGTEGDFCRHAFYMSGNSDAVAATDGRVAVRRLPSHCCVARDGRDHPDA